MKLFVDDNDLVFGATEFFYWLSHYGQIFDVYGDQSSGFNVQL